MYNIKHECCILMHWTRVNLELIYICSTLAGNRKIARVAESLTAKEREAITNTARHNEPCHMTAQIHRLQNQT